MTKAEEPLYDRTSGKIVLGIVLPELLISFNWSSTTLRKTLLLITMGEWQNKYLYNAYCNKQN